MLLQPIGKGAELLVPRTTFPNLGWKGLFRSSSYDGILGLGSIDISWHLNIIGPEQLIKLVNY